MIDELGRPSCDAEIEESLETREGCFVKDSQIGPFLGVARKKEEDKCKSWIESGMLNKSANGIASKA